MENHLLSKCRICLTEESIMHFLFDQSDQNLKLAEIFYDTMKFEIKDDDDLPQYLCETCLSVIIDFYNLKIVYKENEKQIKTLLDVRHNLNFKQLDKVASQPEDTIRLEIIPDNEIESDERPNPHDNENIVIELKQTDEPLADLQENRQHKYTCDVCGLGFPRISYLNDHKDSHRKERKYVCEYCQKAFQRRTVLVKHRRIHTNPRECICEMCGKAFNDKGTLKTHVMLVHVKTRNFICMICGLRFPLKATLDKHIKRHEDRLREYHCELCPLAYKDKSSLQRHFMVKHSGKNQRVACECGREYATIGNLHKHQKACHTNKDDEDIDSK